MSASPVRSFVQPGTGKTLKLGRHVPKVIYPHLHMHNYVKRTMPAPPASVNYSIAASSWLENILGNDDLGDCLDAAAFHIGGVLLANAGQPIPFALSDVVKFYSATAGYVPGDASTDLGGTWQQTLAYWQSTGLTPGAHQIDGYVSVNPADIEECQTAMWLFENLAIGMSLPDDYVNPMPSASGFIWDKAGPPNPQNGHAVCGIASTTTTGVIIDSWGMKGLMTWAAIAKYCVPANGGELYTAFSRDAINNAMGVAPNGFDWTDLDADLGHLSSVFHYRPRPVA